MELKAQMIRNQQAHAHALSAVQEDNEDAHFDRAHVSAREEKAENQWKKQQYALELQEQIRSQQQTRRHASAGSGRTPAHGLDQPGFDTPGHGYDALEAEHAKAEAERKKLEYARELQHQMRSQANAQRRRSDSGTPRGLGGESAHGKVPHDGLNVHQSDSNITGGALPGSMNAGVVDARAQELRRKKEYALQLQEQMRSNNSSKGVCARERDADVAGDRGASTQGRLEHEREEKERQKSEAMRKKREYAAELEEQMRANNAGKDMILSKNVPERGAAFLVPVSEEEDKERAKAEALRRKREYARELEEQIRSNGQNQHRHNGRNAHNNTDVYPGDGEAHTKGAHSHQHDADDVTGHAHKTRGGMLVGDALGPSSHGPGDEYIHSASTGGVHTHDSGNESSYSRGGMTYSGRGNEALEPGMARAPGMERMLAAERAPGNRGASIATIGMAESQCNADVDMKKAMYAQELLRQVCMYVCMNDVYVCMCARMYMRGNMRVCTYTCMVACMYMFMHMQTYTRVCLCMYA
jgi:hypothetical protein